MCPDWSHMSLCPPYYLYGARPMCRWERLSWRPSHLLPFYNHICVHISNSSSLTRAWKGCCPCHGFHTQTGQKGCRLSWGYKSVAYDAYHPYVLPRQCEWACVLWSTQSFGASCWKLLALVLTECSLRCRDLLFDLYWTGALKPLFYIWDTDLGANEVYVG